MSGVSGNPQHTCRHSWVSIHQPDMPVYWIRQCSFCCRFDADDLRREIARTRCVIPTADDEAAHAEVEAELAAEAGEVRY